MISKPETRAGNRPANLSAWTLAALVVMTAACGSGDVDATTNTTASPHPATTSTTASPLPSTSTLPPTTVVGTTSVPAVVERVDPSVFDYDATAELNYEEDPEALDLPVPDTDVHRFTYDSPHAGQVTGLVAHPPEGESDAAILLMHGIPEGTEAYIEPLVFLSCTGATVMAIDAPFVRAGRVATALTFTEGDRDEQIQLIAELRRAVDVLESMGAERITFDGTSWGAAIGAQLAGVEPRIDGYALMLGGPIVEFFFRDGKAIFPLNSYPQEDIDTWVEAMSPIDPTLYVGDATTPILFQNGTKDTRVVPESAAKLHEAAGPDHDVRWYPDTHDGSPELVAEHIHWQAEILDLDPDRVDECVGPLLGG